MAHQLIPSPQEGVLCHIELLITLDKASWHPIRPEIPVLLQHLKLMRVHSGKPSLLPLQIFSAKKEVVKLKDTETVCYQIKNRAPLMYGES